MVPERVTVVVDCRAGGFAASSCAGVVRSRHVREPAEAAAPAAAPAPEAVEAAALGVDMERGVVVGMEGTQVVVVAGTKLNADQRPQCRELSSFTLRAC